MKIIQSLPRRMRFEARAASSVELCVSEWVSGSRYRDTTTVVAERSDAPPLLDVDVYRLAPAKRLSSWHLGLSVRRLVKAGGYDLVVTQQHVATAARVALFNPGTPVVLQTHNFVDPPKTGRGSSFANALVERRLKSLGGITLISQATLAQFEKDWPGVRIPRKVVNNGFDFSSWNPSAEREKSIIVVGRVRPEKGILEAAEGVARFLPGHPDWTARFILSEPKADERYFAAIQAALAPLGSQCEMLIDIPFPTVKSMTERSAVAIVASKWIEPFGRTALEAHAAGVALVSSGTGGLREISGEAAAFLPEVSGPAIAAALERLAADDAARQRLAEAGARRVRELFSLTPAAGMGADVVPVSRRLDDFYDEVLAHARRT